MKEDFPGPGQYEEQPSVAGPHYSIGLNRPENNDNSVPGPGSYNPRKDYCKSSVPSFILGKSRRMIVKDQGTPGPGSYNLSSSFSGPRWRVGTQKRRSASCEDIPGPGSYESKFSFNAPSFSISAKRPKTSDNRVPGPGAYTPKYEHTNIFYSVGQAHRKTHTFYDNPGPASYNLDLPTSPGIVFGSSKRKWKSSTEKNPGPGTYDTMTAWDGPKISLKSKTWFKPSNENPVTFM